MTSKVSCMNTEGLITKKCVAMHTNYFLKPLMKWLILRYLSNKNFLSVVEIKLF